MLTIYELCLTEAFTDIDNTSVTATKGELPMLPNYKKLYTDLKDDYVAIHSTQKRVSSIRLSSSANNSFSSSFIRSFFYLSLLLAYCVNWKTFVITIAHTAPLTRRL